MSFKRGSDFARLIAPPEDLGSVFGKSTEDRPVILVVDDDETVRQVVRAVLTADGYAILDAPDGHKALNLWASLGGYIDLVLTDFNMPGMSGTDLAVTLWAQDAHVPVIYMSGWSELDIALEHLQTKHVGFLAKPFTMAVLIETVAKGLRCGPELTSRAETKLAGRNI